MIDIKFLRENPELVRENIKKKFQDSKLPLVDRVIALDEELRTSKKRADDLRANRNKVSKSIGALMGQKKFEEAEEAKKLVSRQAEELAALEAKEEELAEEQAVPDEGKSDGEHQKGRSAPQPCLPQSAPRGAGQQISESTPKEGKGGQPKQAHEPHGGQDGLRPQRMDGGEGAPHREPRQKRGGQSQPAADECRQGKNSRCSMMLLHNTTSPHKVLYSMRFYAGAPRVMTGNTLTDCFPTLKRS